jgi:hypothetical protein
VDKFVEVSLLVFYAFTTATIEILAELSCILSASRSTHVPPGTPTLLSGTCPKDELLCEQPHSNSQRQKNKVLTHEVGSAPHPDPSTDETSADIGDRHRNPQGP